ncbi:MAG: response regulator [Bacteroidetes bacterium]|nr:response regulator [Bacteroidota bacterium]
MNKDHFVIKNIKVLYVEDEPDISEGIVEMLSRIIPDLIVASNGIEGLKLYKEFKPGIVITDIRMPGMSGLEMTREIKKIDKNVQVIVTSAHSDINYFIESIEIGVNQYVLKPIAKQKLFEAIHKSYQVITLEEKVNEQINTILKLFRAIEQSQSMILIADKNLNIEYVNPRFSDVTGYSVSEVMGLEPKVAYLKTSSIINDSEVWRMLSGGKEWRGEFLNKKKSGEEYWEYGSFTPIKNDNGEIVSYVQVTEDITEMKYYIEELKIAREEAESAYATIEKRNAELNEANEKLKKSETKLSEMNEILMEYIKATGK